MRSIYGNNQYVKSGAGYGGAVINSTPNYDAYESGIWRHNYTTQNPTTGASPLAANEYLAFTIARFKRTFAPGVTNDLPPTPTNSNNYQSESVFNGSYIKDLNCVIKLANTGGAPVYLDIYEVCLSWFDALIWNTVYPANCPVIMTTAGGAGDDRGTVVFKTMLSTYVTDNVLKSYKGIQHYMKKVGTITLGSTDSGSETAEIILNQFPDKVRRSQTGMFYGYIIHNNSDANNGNSITMRYSIDNSFTEIPSTNRLPYLI